MPQGVLHIDNFRTSLIPRLVKLRELYLSGRLGEVEHEVHPDLDRGSRGNYLYFTLAPALNFQRRSEALWRAALATYQDPQTRFVFYPENCERGVHEYQDALTKYGLALQPTKHTSIWFRISSTLEGRYRSDPRVLLSECSFDVPVVKLRLSQAKKDFPYLGGPKLSNYWLYILSFFTDVRLRNRHEISVIPDVHVIRASKRLGLFPQESTPKPEAVAKAWRELLEGSELAPSDLHAPLWRWSRRDFTPAL